MSAIPSSDIQPSANEVSIFSNIPKYLVPNCIKALDRLIGASVDIPVAWLNRKKSQIDSQVQSYALVENEIAKLVTAELKKHDSIINDAISVLVRSSYRKHSNKAAVADAMIEELQKNSDNLDNNIPSSKQIDDDWLNVFERFAEDASSKKLQDLWGRVIAGEIRKPGNYSLRTIRFLSEFSQSDAINFSKFCDSVFSSNAPLKLVKPDDNLIGDLVDLEASGLIQYGTGSFVSEIVFDNRGIALLTEGNTCILLKSFSGYRCEFRSAFLTKLGTEIVTLLSDRDIKAAGKNVALAIKNIYITSAVIGKVLDRNIMKVEIEDTIWGNSEDFHVEC